MEDALLLNKKVILTFIISLIISYLIIGYLGSNLFVSIDWIENVTLADKLREYYIRTFSYNISFSLPISLIISYITFKKTNK